jgi:hypothetical protein
MGKGLDSPFGSSQHPTHGSVTTWRGVPEGVGVPTSHHERRSES